MLLGIHLVAIMSAVLRAWTWSLETSFVLVPPELVEHRGYLMPLELVTVLVVIGTAVAWMNWQDLAHKDLFALGGDPGFPPTPGVWWWFFPGANLWMPYRIVSSIASSTEELNRRGPRSGIITGWWLLFVPGILCWSVGRILAPTLSTRSTLVYTRNVLRLEFFGDLGLIIAAALAIVVVGRITNGLGFAERHRRFVASSVTTGSTAAD